MDCIEIYDSPFQCETSSDEFVCHARLPSLQEMTYNQIAIAVWYKYRSTPSQQHHEEWHIKTNYKLELMDCHNLIKTLTMPRFMKEILKKYLERVHVQTIRCTYYFVYELLSTNLDEYRIRQVDWECFVWRPDGRINYKSTAIKLLHSDVLTEVQKFAIMSDFCMENEIKIFGLNHRPMETFIPKVNEDRDPLLFYWIWYLKNELHKIASFFYDYHFERLHSMYEMRHGAAFEYFWNRLNAKAQVYFISRRLFTRDYYHWHRSLYYKMSHDQLSKFVFSHSVAMILLFIKEIVMPEWAILAWKRCKNRISNEQFVQLLDIAFDSCDKSPMLRQEYKMRALLEIWNTANDHQKNHAAEQTPLGTAVCHSILSASSSLQFLSVPNRLLWKELAPSSFKFLLKFLSSKFEDFGEDLILRGDPIFIFNFDLNVVDEIFDLCLPNFKGEEEYKYERSRIIRPYFCEILYSEEDHDELNRRLLRSFQNLNISLNDKLKQFIESLIIANKKKCETYYPLVGVGGHHIYYLKRLSKFTNKIFQENVSTVLKMKESFFSSFSVTSDPYERYGSLNELSKLIEQEFVHEHLQELKNRLAEKLQAISVYEWGWYALHYRKFRSIFSWCYENEEEMFLQVKRYIVPINNIVGDALETIVRRDIYLSSSLTSHFHSLERFLEWYFSGVAEKVISFKLGGILNDPKIAEMLERVQNDKGYEWLRTMFLQWNWPV